MKSYTVAPRARRDLREAWTYSRDRWGRSRADRYLRDITDSMSLIAQNPMIGQDCGDISPGYRKHPSGSHVLFFEVRDEVVVIIRVLHQQMDVEDKF